MQLGARLKDGSTLRDHLQAAVRQGALPDPRLLERLPEHGAALWDAFAALSTSRPAGMGGASAVPPSEIAAWQQLHGVRLTGWEIDTLCAMDRAALAVMAEHNRAQ
jgi:hypothetical protein